MSKPDFGPWALAVECNGERLGQASSEELADVVEGLTEIVG